MQVVWDHTDQAEWETLADQGQAPMQQRWTYGAVHAALGGQVMRAVVYENGTPIAMCQCVVRRVAGVLNLSLATHGPLWLAPCDQPRALALLRKTAPLHRPRIQLFTPRENLKSRRLILLMTPATCASAALPISRKTLHGKWRNALTRAENSGLRTRNITCPSKTLLSLLETDADQQRQKGYRALPAAFTLKWHQIAPDDLRLITASKDGQTVATALFLHHGNTASYHIAHTSDPGRKLSAQRLVIWRAYTDFVKQGVKRVDLGSIDTENAAGLARFKLGAGANTQRLGPTVLAL